MPGAMTPSTARRSGQCRPTVQRGATGAVVHVAGCNDEREWLELFGHLMTTPLTALPAGQLALKLCATFEATACGYSDIVGSEHTAELWPLHQQLHGHRSELFEWSMSHGDDHPLLRFYHSTALRVPAQIADLPPGVAGSASAREWLDIGRSTGCPDQLSLPLRLHVGRSRAFVLGRTGRFSSPEIELATMLWRLLTALDRQIAVAHRLATRAAVARPAVADNAGLTPREIAVLGLLGDGITAGAIGRRLIISERTVHKHLERIYGKLSVADRLGAVLRAREVGLLTDT
jgi:DNA-binding CsgD family transcriptional regulator